LISAGAPPVIRKINEKHDKVFATGCTDPVVNAQGPRANAVFVVLARNKELDGVIESLKSMERHFNRWFNYPYVFLNDGDFNQTFKDVVRNHTSSNVEFGKIGPEHWGFPNWTDANVAKEGIRKQGDAAIMYGGMESYHHMCRFYSGFFYKHELLQKYDWYWRVEPEIKYFCDMTYDPFIHMERNNKTYGFTIAVKELKETVPNIFRYASAYKRKYNKPSQGLWEMFVEPKEGFNQDGTPKKDYKKEEKKKDEHYPPGQAPLPDIDPEAMEGEVYNMCHFWSNFEIARLDWFRSQEYEDFFNMMDKSGGFWMERVSLAVSRRWSLEYLKLTIYCSGVMLPSTPSPPAPSSRRNKSITSATTATVTLPSSIAPPMHPLANYRIFPGSRRPPKTRKLGKRRTITGRSRIRSKRMVSGAGVVVIQISSRSRPKREAVFRSGWRLLEVILPLRGQRGNPLVVAVDDYDRRQGKKQMLASLSTWVLS
jgi:hypothetical protein